MYNYICTYLYMYIKINICAYIGAYACAYVYKVYNMPGTTNRLLSTMNLIFKYHSSRIQS